MSSSDTDDVDESDENSLTSCDSDVMDVGDNDSLTSNDSDGMDVGDEDSLESSNADSNVDHLLQEMQHLIGKTEKEFEKSAETTAKIKKLFFFDLQIVCSVDCILPCHKYVLSSRSEILRMEVSSGTNELNWTEYEAYIGCALLRWFYTDKIDLDSDTLALGLLRASFHFQLPTLFEACERMLVTTVNENSSLKYHCIAKEVGANMLAEKCLQFTPIHCDNSPSASLDVGDNDKATFINLCDMYLGEITSIPQQHLLELKNRVRAVAENQAKLKGIVDGISTYLTFSDKRISYNYGRYWPAHVYVFSSRSEVLSKEMSSESGENYWFDFSKDCAHALLRWLYTDSIVLDNKKLILDLLHASHKFQLSSLFQLCEEAIVLTINLSSCAEMLHIAIKVGSTKILKHCKELLSAYWNDLQSNDINELSKIIINDNKPQLQSPQVIPAFQFSPMETSETPIMKLNDDCLLEIFKYISLIDLGSIKDTCERFSKLADQSYKVYGNKTFSINSSSVIADIWNLKHFGKFINSLTIDNHKTYYWSWDDIFAMIAKFCNPKLKRFYLNFEVEPDIFDETLKHLKEILRNVEIIELGYFDYDRQIEVLLGYCENLKEVHIEGNDMDLNTLWCIKNCNIKRITLSMMINDNVLEGICEKLLHLEYLAFDCLPALNVETGKIHHLIQLNHLKELKIQSRDDIGLLLKNLAKKNVLEYLSLSYFDMNESVAHALGDFTKLKELTLNQIDYQIPENILDILSKKLLNIEKLYFDDCEQLTCRDVTKIIENHLKLKELLITGCAIIDSIDRDNYRKLRKPRNLKIFLDTSVYESTVKLISGDLSNFVQVAIMPEKWNRWHP